MGREGGGRNAQVEGREKLRRVWEEAGRYAGWLAVLFAMVPHGRAPGKAARKSPCWATEVAWDSKLAGTRAGRNLEAHI